MASIEAVCFDLDNTLCVNAQSDTEIHQALFEAVDIEPTFTVDDVQRVDPAELPETDSVQAFYEELYRAVTDDLTATEYSELAETTLDIIDETDVEFRDGAQEALRYTRDQYDAVGLLTYGDPERQTAKLDVLDIRDLFDSVVICGPATDVAGKPEPEAFRTVLDGLGSTPEASIYIGDSLQGDIGGANNVGMASAWVPLDFPPANPEPEPTYVLESPTEVREIL